MAQARHILIVFAALALLASTWSASSIAQPAPARASTCTPPPAPVRDLAIPRFYGDADGAKVDPELAKLHAAAVEPLVAFLRTIAEASDKASDRDPSRALCALSWLETWAAGDAWLGDMVTQQAEYQRKWDLAGIALAYVKLRPLATSPQQRATIEAWLQRWAAKARSFFDAPERKRNNHWYWLGLGLLATSLATDSTPHWEAAAAIFRDALKDIRADGVLPMELERQERALFYHVFAMMPLVVMAEIAARRGEDWYALDGGALHRLIALCAHGLGAPGQFAAVAGKPQEQPVNARAGWLSLYVARFPERLPAALRRLDVPDKHRWLGGDVRVLMRTLERR